VARGLQESVVACGTRLLIATSAPPLREETDVSRENTESCVADYFISETKFNGGECFQEIFVID
jgi:hypothetical protein